MARHTLAAVLVLLGLAKGAAAPMPPAELPPIEMPPVEISGRQIPSSGVLGDDCHHVYLDVGGNIGVQTRKLFEQARYPRSEVLPTFDRFFGAAELRGNMSCAIGFEPNEHHFPRLRELARRYTAIGFRTTYIFAAAGDRNATMSLFLPRKNEGEAAAALRPLGPASAENGMKAVPVLDLSEFILRHVSRRHLPAHSPSATGRQTPPAVVAKIDIEHAERTVVPHLFRTRAACATDTMLVEWHGRRDLFGRILDQSRLDAVNCTQLVEQDDEYFAADPHPLPKDPSHAGGGGGKDLWSEMTFKNNKAFWRDDLPKTRSRRLFLERNG